MVFALPGVRPRASRSSTWTRTTRSSRSRVWSTRKRKRPPLPQRRTRRQNRPPSSQVQASPRFGWPLAHVRAAFTVLVLSTTLASCSSADERVLLTQFFAASRLRDLTAIQNVATVVFEPATDGIVTSFELMRVSVLEPSAGQPLSEEVSISAPVKL